MKERTLTNTCKNSQMICLFYDCCHVLFFRNTGFSGYHEIHLYFNYSSFSANVLVCTGTSQWMGLTAVWKKIKKRKGKRKRLKYKKIFIIKTPRGKKECILFNETTIIKYIFSVKINSSDSKWLFCEKGWKKCILVFVGFHPEEGDMRLMCLCKRLIFHIHISLILISFHFLFIV